MSRLRNIVRAMLGRADDASSQRLDAMENRIAELEDGVGAVSRAIRKALQPAHRIDPEARVQKGFKPYLRLSKHPNPKNLRQFWIVMVPYTATRPSNIEDFRLARAIQHARHLNATEGRICEGSIMRWVGGPPQPKAKRR